MNNRRTNWIVQKIKNYWFFFNWTNKKHRNNVLKSLTIVRIFRISQTVDERVLVHSFEKDSCLTLHTIFFQTNVYAERTIFNRSNVKWWYFYNQKNFPNKLSKTLTFSYRTHDLLDRTDEKNSNYERTNRKK